MLQGHSGDDMVLPIAGYNPMGKEHILEKIEELNKLHCEQIGANVCTDINQITEHKNGSVFNVVVNLADDLGGAWTNKYTTDYTSKFKIGPLVKRSFCAPHFWTSEDYDATIIRERFKQYILRTIYFSKHGKPITLADHVKQEGFATSLIGTAEHDHKPEIPKSLKTYYEEHRHTEDYGRIFNFFYGDQASNSLGYPAYGITRGYFDL